MEKRYECYHCNACPTEKEWNEHNKLVIITFGIDPLPEGLDGGRYDCPECDQVICGEDLREV